jgi:hypothetical protein
MVKSEEMASNTESGKNITVLSVILEIHRRIRFVCCAVSTNNSEIYLRVLCVTQENKDLLCHPPSMQSVQCS